MIPLQPPKGITFGNHLLRSLKTREFSSVIHLGELNQNEQSRSSHEGCLISASTCPDAWQKIARLGGQPKWEITHIDSDRKLRFVDILHKNTQTTIVDEGIRQNLLIMEKWWKTPVSTDEEGNVRFTWTKNPEEYRNDWMEIGKKPTIHIKPVPNTDLIEFWCQRKSGFDLEKEQTPWHALDMMLDAMIAKHQQTESYPKIDGIFWNEILDPDALSAPRMGVSSHPRLKFNKL